jgi:cell division protein FtsQ
MPTVDRTKKKPRRRAEAQATPKGRRWKAVLAPYVRPFAGVALAGMLLAGLVWVANRPIENIEVQAEFAHVSEAQVNETLAPLKNRGFLSVDLEEIRASLAGLPWVDQVRVERCWPPGIRVTLTEQVPVAHWNERGLINRRGELFLREAPRLDVTLPRLGGPVGAEHEVAGLYFAAQAELERAGMALAQVKLDPRGAWELVVGDGIRVRLGREAVQKRLATFTKVAAPLLLARGTEVAYVDMRYSNGFAVGWNSRAGRASAAKVSRADG